MSLSVNGSNTNNPAALWQSLLSQDSSASSTPQSDPLSKLLSALGQNTGASLSGTSPSSAASSTGSAAATSGSSSPQFGPQTLQALFDLQANGSTSQSLAAQPGGDDTTDTADTNSAQQTQPGEGQHAHRHHMPAGRKAHLTCLLRRKAPPAKPALIPMAHRPPLLPMLTDRR